jgi:hypothetical protein
MPSAMASATSRVLPNIDSYTTNARITRPPAHSSRSNPVRVDPDSADAKGRTSRSSDDAPVTYPRSHAFHGDHRCGGAGLVVIPTDALDPAFFDLRSGLAGELLQKCVTYGLRLEIVGPLPAVARSSRSFNAFVSESNRGSQIRFELDVSPGQASGGPSG